MIKGAQKRMIVIRTKNSRYFDEAYFVLRGEVRSDADNGADMIREANRILEESRPATSPRRRRRRGWLLFLAGLFCGCAAVGLLWLLL